MPAENEDLSGWYLSTHAVCYSPGWEFMLDYAEGELGSLPGIDKDAGLNSVRGNKKQFIKLLKLFQEKQPLTIDSIQNNDQSAMDVVIQQAHALKGVSGNLGTKTIHTAADDLELAC